MSQERTPKRKGNNGNHGAKGRSGRRPTAVTLLKRRLIENKIDEAEASFAFLVAVRDNEDEPTALRVAAAEQILDRVLGKAKQQVSADVNAVGSITINVKRIEHRPDAIPSAG